MIGIISAKSAERLIFQQFSLQICGPNFPGPETLKFPLEIPWRGTWNHCTYGA